jgi:hypothetical protein
MEKTKGSDPNKALYVKCPIDSWEDLIELYYGKSKRCNVNFSLLPNKQTRWIFRGESTKNEKDGLELRTHLEKAFDCYAVPENKKRKYEIDLIRKFQRKASLYIKHEPPKDDVLEWLALMRHHGAATRLMDWSYSFFIALYFALAERPDVGIIWALNVADINKPGPAVKRISKAGHGKKLRRLHRRFYRTNDVLKIRARGDKLRDLSISCCLMNNPVVLVYPVNPFKLNTRLVIQQGLFLLPGDVEKPFLQNLEGTFACQGGLEKYLYRIELKFDRNITKDKEARNEILRQLHDMGINNAMLFPDLDGFAKSVTESLAYPQVFAQDTRRH